MLDFCNHLITFQNSKINLKYHWLAYFGPFQQRQITKILQENSNFTNFLILSPLVHPIIKPNFSNLTNLEGVFLGSKAENKKFSKKYQNFINLHKILKLHQNKLQNEIFPEILEFLDQTVTQENSLTKNFHGSRKKILYMSIEPKGSKEVFGIDSNLIFLEHNLFLNELFYGPGGIGREDFMLLDANMTNIGWVSKSFGINWLQKMRFLVT